MFSRAKIFHRAATAALASAVLTGALLAAPASSSPSNGQAAELTASVIEGLTGSITVEASEAYDFDAATGLLTVYTDEGTTSWRNSIPATSVQHLVVAGSVNNIRNYAFRETNLIDVTVQSGVMYIGKAAFRGCPSLSMIALPESIAAIQDSAFMDCPLLSSITVIDAMGASNWLQNIITRGTTDAARNYVLCVPTSAVGTYQTKATDLMTRIPDTNIAVIASTESPYYGTVALTDYDADPNGYTEFIARTLGQISGAPYKSTVHIQTDKYLSFPDSVLRALNDRTDLQLAVTYKSEDGATKTFVIPKEYNALRVFGNGSGYVSFETMYMRL